MGYPHLNAINYYTPRIERYLLSQIYPYRTSAPGKRGKATMILHDLIINPAALDAAGWRLHNHWAFISNAHRYIIA
jgi:hypothetical protein